MADAKTKELATQVVNLFRQAGKIIGDVKLCSIKVALPEGADPDKVSKYIKRQYHSYKVHSKDPENGKRY